MYYQNNNNAPLKDAFNREVFPNTGAPGSHGMSSASFNPGFGVTSANAYDTSGSGAYASYEPSDTYSSPGFYTPPSPIPPTYQQSDCQTCDIQPSSFSQGVSDYAYTSQPYNNQPQYPPQPPSYGMMLQQMNHSMQQQPQNAMSQQQQSVYDTLVKYLKQTVSAISQQLKVKPDYIDITPDGGACWKYSTMVNGNSLWCRVFNRVEVNAERKASKTPVPHLTTLTTTTKIKLSDEIVAQLRKDFPMVSYCPTTKELRITMDSLEHNLAMLSLICAAEQGKLSLNKIKYYELPKKYLLLTTPGHAKYKRGAKYSLVRMIRQ